MYSGFLLRFLLIVNKGSVRELGLTFTTGDANGAKEDRGDSRGAGTKPEVCAYLRGNWSRIGSKSMMGRNQIRYQ